MNEFLQFQETWDLKKIQIFKTVFKDELNNKSAFFIFFSRTNSSVIIDILKFFLKDHLSNIPGFFFRFFVKGYLSNKLEFLTHF